MTRAEQRAAKLKQDAFNKKVPEILMLKTGVPKKVR
jgi:hypothetical protein